MVWKESGDEQYDWTQSEREFFADDVPGFNRTALVPSQFGLLPGKLALRYYHGIRMAFLNFRESIQFCRDYFTLKKTVTVSNGIGDNNILHSPFIPRGLAWYLTFSYRGTWKGPSQQHLVNRVPSFWPMRTRRPKTPLKPAICIDWTPPLKKGHRSIFFWAINPLLL